MPSQHRPIINSNSNVFYVINGGLLMNRFFLKLIIGLFFFTSITAYAQEYKSYATSGNWNILYTNKGCFAFPTDSEKSVPAGKARIQIAMNKKENRVILNFGKSARWVKDGFTYLVTFKLGKGLEFHGVGMGMTGPSTGGNLLFTDFPNQYLNNISKASVLPIEIKDDPKVKGVSRKVSVIPLNKGSGILQTMRRCVREKI